MSKKFRGLKKMAFLDVVGRLVARGVIDPSVKKYSEIPMDVREQIKREMLERYGLKISDAELNTYLRRYVIDGAFWTVWELTFHYPFKEFDPLRNEPAWIQKRQFVEVAEDEEPGQSQVSSEVARQETNEFKRQREKKQTKSISDVLSKLREDIEVTKTPTAGETGSEEEEEEYEGTPIEYFEEEVELPEDKEVKIVKKVALDPEVLMIFRVARALGYRGNLSRFINDCIKYLFLKEKVRPGLIVG